MSENMRKIDKNKQKTRQKGKYLTTKIANEEFLCQTQTKIRLIEVPKRKYPKQKLCSIILRTYETNTLSTMKIHMLRASRVPY